MAPEQFSDAITADPASVRTDTWSDVFSLGVILFELISGTVPFPVRERPKPGAIKKAVYRYMLQRLKATDDDVPRCRGIDQPLDSIVRKALRSDPRQRQPNAKALKDDLDRYLETGRGVRRAYDTYTEAMSLKDIEELQSLRKKTQDAIDAMETVLAEDEDKKDIQREVLDEEGDDEDDDEDTVADPTRTSIRDDDRHHHTTESVFKHTVVLDALDLTSLGPKEKDSKPAKPSHPRSKKGARSD